MIRLATANSGGSAFHSVLNSQWAIPLAASPEPRWALGDTRLIQFAFRIFQHRTGSTANDLRTASCCPAKS
jgi:hypothetical protein